MAYQFLEPLKFSQNHAIKLPMASIQSLSTPIALLIHSFKSFK